MIDRRRAYAVAVAGEPLHARPLLEGQLDPDPLAAFGAWYEEAGRYVRAPEAMAVATATPDGVPSVRMVLLKSFDERGFVFYTSYASRKGLELDANPRASLLFHWEPVGRQARIEGVVERVSREESADYFAARPESSRLSATASRQSSPIQDRQSLEARVEALRRELAGREIPLPDHWGGYRLLPDSYEFWQHRDDRLHDRLRYRRVGSSWVVERLAP
jgi:pyridoxamine 5'-phosphate oxidase